MNRLGRRLSSLLLAGAVTFSTMSMDVLAAENITDPAGITEEAASEEDEAEEADTETEEETDSTEDTKEEDKSEKGESETEEDAEEDKEGAEEGSDEETEKEDGEKSDKETDEDSEDEGSEKDDEESDEDEDSEKDEEESDEDEDSEKDEEESEEDDEESEEDEESEKSDDPTVKKHTHIKEYTSNEDGTHTATCSFEGCKYEVVQDCIFEKGICKRCGFEEVVEAEALDYSETIGGYTIKLTAEAGVLPNDVEVTIKKVTAVAGVSVEALIEDNLEEETEIAEIVSFDISFSVDGVEVEPENGAVNVSILLADEIKEAEEESESAEIKIFHVDDEAVVSEVDASVDGEVATFEAEEFSVYTIVVLNAEPTSGTMGDMSWKLTSNTTGLTLTISGTGDMPSSFGGYPWVSNKSKITQVVITGSISNIEGYTFQNYTRLTSAKIGDAVETIGPLAFSGCTSLQTLTIGNNVSSIGDAAFENCKLLSSVVIPNSVSIIGSSAFKDCTGLKTIKFGTGVSEINAYAFKNCASLTSVALPGSLRNIYGSAFEACKSMASLTLPEGIVNIYDSAFADCVTLKAVSIPNSVMYLSYGVFSGCSALTSVSIGTGITEIDNSTFYNCKSLTTVTIPSNVTVIGQSAFGGCNLKTVNLSEGLTEIGWGAFGGNKSLVSITIPKTVRTISNYAFGSCVALNKVILQEGLQVIQSYAFDNCNALKSIIIPKSVVNIEWFVFPTDTVIYGVLGSAAEEYAKKYGNVFISSKAASYRVVFNANGATGGTVPATKTLTFAQAYAIPACTLVKPCYTFAGWSLDPKGTGSIFADKAVISGLASQNGAIVNLYAIWTPNKYKIAFYGNGATSGTMAKLSCKAGVTYTLTANAFARTGYIFSGWNTKADGSGKTYANKASVINLSTVDGATIKLYARWKPKAPTVTNISNVNDGIKLAWTPIDNASGYYVYKSVNGGAYQKIDSSVKYTYTDTTATVNGLKYQYKVVAYIKDASSKLLSDASAEVTMFRMIKPKISSVTNPTAGAAAVSWTTNKYAYGYQVIYGTDSEFGTYKTLVITPGTTASKIVTNLKKGKTYYFKVRSYGVFEGKIYYSKWSTPTSITLTK